MFLAIFIATYSIISKELGLSIVVNSYKIKHRYDSPVFFTVGVGNRYQLSDYQIYLANTINSQIRIMFISYAQMTKRCDFPYIKINYYYPYTCV